ncbi:hypothetical protein BDP27DRAFT_939759 [Rhodocollybia butyracea]|uniref:Uncharacterized protein n=1 Tax=Rhodocollybia butyracea TaxID=206335 RepID=A0A9P5P4Y9_9AGAR|nr:hypothetical protein BDP27DRAFT_939759 [Rhodocollybia butyracea]
MLGTGTMTKCKSGSSVRFGGKKAVEAYRSCYRLLRNVMRDKLLELDEVYEWLMNYTTRGDSVSTHVDLAVMGGAEKLCGQ